MVPFGHPPASWCLGFVKKKKSSGQTFLLPYNLVTFKQAVHPWSNCRVTYMKWRVPETCGLKLIPPELLEDLVINPCPVSTSQSSFITIPVHCGSSCLGRVFFSSGRNTLHFVHWSALHIWSTSLRCARTQIYIVQHTMQHFPVTHSKPAAGHIWGSGCYVWDACPVWSLGHLGSLQYSAVFNTQQYSQMFLQQGDRPSGNNMHLLASAHLGTSVTLTMCADPVPWVLCCQHTCHTRASSANSYPQANHLGISGGSQNYTVTFIT